MTHDATYGPGAGPPARPQGEAQLLELLAVNQHCVLATNTANGFPHLTNMLYTLTQRTARSGSAPPRSGSRSATSSAIRAALCMSPPVIGGHSPSRKATPISHP